MSINLDDADEVKALAEQIQETAAEEAKRWEQIAEEIE